MLGVVCRDRPICMVGWKLGVANGGHVLTPHRIAPISNGEQGNGGVAKDRLVALAELCEDLVGSPFQSIIKVVALSHGKPSHHSQVSGMNQNVHMDLAAPKPKLTERAAMVCRNPRVAKVVQHILMQGGKTGAVKPSQRNNPLALRVALG
jgi:hypothetical protein